MVVPTMRFAHLTSGVQVFAQQHPLVLKLEAEVMAKVLSCSEPLDAGNVSQKM
jgi:hypothetical protein